MSNCVCGRSQQEHDDCKCGHCGSRHYTDESGITVCEPDNGGCKCTEFRDAIPCTEYRPDTPKQESEAKHEGQNSSIEKMREWDGSYANETPSEIEYRELLRKRFLKRCGTPGKIWGTAYDQTAANLGFNCGWNNAKAFFTEQVIDEFVRRVEEGVERDRPRHGTDDYRFDYSKVMRSVAEEMKNETK